MGIDAATPAGAAYPVVGSPMVYVAGFVVLVLLTFAHTWARSLVTVAHEGGHIVVAILTLRNPTTFYVEENVGGGATEIDAGWGAGMILSLLAGYLTPPLAGLAGAHLLVAGKAWSLLWAAFFLLLGAYFKAKDLFTLLIVLIAGAGIGWTAVKGGAELQAGVAAGVVWLMLMGGVASLPGQGLGVAGSDAAALARYTWIPRIIWVALFWCVALLCLAAGTLRLVGR